jgi:hypothetical protein
MTIRHPWVKGLAYVAAPVTVLCVALTIPAASIAQTPPDTLTLRRVENVTAWREYDASRNQFTVWLKWDDIPDSIATLIHRPDTLGWGLVSPADSLSLPSSGGVYTGNIDRTVGFRATLGGVVGQDSIPITYSLLREEEWSGLINIGTGYTPGSWVPVRFRNQQRETLDLGLQLSFSPGKVDPQGQFKVGLEDFEGFHIWRGIATDGSDLEVIGELSKEEAFRGGGPGGSVTDSLYWYGVVPGLRETGIYRLPAATQCLGFYIEQQLEDNELLWFDCNAFNGFTYQYMVTTFDRGYLVNSGRQGLVKFDYCEAGLELPLADSCLADLVPLHVQVDPQDNLSAVYAVPNPYRTGGSRLTTPNYHNFPDDKVRFVNVPTDCRIKIYTVSGDLVWEYTHHSIDGGGNIEWDVTNLGGESVTSGVYIYRIEDSKGGQVYGRLIIIR